jgi:hypothetical protein
MLPAVYEVCEKLGIAHDACITDHKYGTTAISSYAANQTDPDLWYGVGTASADPIRAGECPGAIPIRHYWTMFGDMGTEYVCKVLPEDDTLTPAEVKAFQRYADHTNSIAKKTLAEHEVAMQVKQMAKWLATH